MKAYKIYENLEFTQGANPYDSLKIGTLRKIMDQYKNVVNLERDIHEYSPNELLVLAIKNSHGANPYELVDYALNMGANQLWYQQGGVNGGKKADMHIDSFVVILKQKSDHYVVNKLNTVYGWVKPTWKKSTVLRDLFVNKYAPITYLIKNIDDEIKLLRSYKKIINKHESS